MKRIDEFRIYYNHTIHPELMRLERSRKRLLRLLFLSVILMLASLALGLYLRIAPLTLAMMIPFVLYSVFLVSRIQRFLRTFKPHIVSLILDFIDNEVNYGTLSYDSKKFIPKSRFLESKLFASKAQFYVGEDYIKGKVGEMDFEMSELDVRENSAMSAKLEPVFQGIFLCALFNEPTEGSLAVWPRKERRFLTRSIKNYTWAGGQNVDEEIMIENFRETFLVYATEDTHVISILPEPMQEAILDFCAASKKDIYFSVHGREIYVGVSEPKDQLEPFIFRSNMSFELVKEFFENITLLLKIVEVFDQTH